MNQEHFTSAEEAVQKHRSEIESILKDRERQFNAEVEDMNKKMLEKINLKQTELEIMSLKLRDMLNNRQQLEEKLSGLEADNKLAKKKMKLRTNEEQLKFQSEMDNMKHQHEQSLNEKEFFFKEELQKLKSTLKEKSKEFEQYVLKEKMLLEDATKAQQTVEAQLKEMDELRYIVKSERNVLAEANSQLITLREEIEHSNNKLQKADTFIEEIRNECKQTQTCLQQKDDENKELQQKLQQAMNDLVEKENFHAKMYKTIQEDQNQLKRQLDEEKGAYEKRLKLKVKEKQEKLMKKLEEQKEKYKIELANRDHELQLKEQHVIVLEKAQESLTCAVSDLEENHNKKLENLEEVYKQEQCDIICYWQDKLSQQEKELKGKHSVALQEKVRELEEISQKLLNIIDEKEQAVEELNHFRDALTIRETNVQQLQAELKEAAMKLNNLSEAEVMLKKQLQTLEKSLNQDLNERNNFQDMLCKVEDASKEKLLALSKEDTLKKPNVLETSRCKDESMHTLEEKTFELQFKEKEFVILSNICKELDKHCQMAQAVLLNAFDNLNNTLDAKVMKLQNSITCSQTKLCNFKKAILTKNVKISCLEAELQQAVEESDNLKILNNHLSLQLKTLTLEKETLQNNSLTYSHVISEKVICIEKLDEENKNISNQLNANALIISHLESIINNLEKQLTEKEEVISLLNHQSEEKQSRAYQMKDTIQKAENKKSLALEPADHFRNRLSGMEMKEDSKVIQNQTIVEQLQCKILDMERQIAEKDEHIQRLSISIQNQSISKSEIDLLLSEKEQRVSVLTFELDNCTRRIIELEVQFELQAQKQEQELIELQQNHNILESEKMILIEQLQHAKEQKYDFEKKIHLLDKQVQNTKRELENQQRDFESERAHLTKSQIETLKEAEQKEQTIKDIQVQLDDISQRQIEREHQMKIMEENVKVMEATLNNLRKNPTKLMEQQLEEQHNETQNKNALQILNINNKLTAEYLAEDKTDAAFKHIEEALSRLNEAEDRLAESEKQNMAYEAIIGDLEAKLCKQTELVQEFQKTCLVVKVAEQNCAQIKENSLRQTDSLLDPVRTKDKKEAYLSEKDIVEIEHFIQESRNPENHLLRKQMASEIEKETLHKDYAQLQKDIRSLRKEHEKELEFLRKEMAEENEKKNK